MGIKQVIKDIIEERLRQDEKWGVQNHLDLTWNAILMEEVGEAAQEILTQSFGAAANGHGDLREELVQIAAVAVAWIEALDRRFPSESVNKLSDQLELQFNKKGFK